MIERRCTRASLVLRHQLRHHFQPAWRRKPTNPAQLTQLREIPLLVAVVERPADAGARPRELAGNHESKSVLFLVVEADLAEWNAKLGDPAERVDFGRHIPDGVPVRILVVVVVDVEVSLHTSRIDAELIT